MSRDFTESLEAAITLIAELLHSLHTFPFDNLLFHAPIIDRYSPNTWRQDEVLGLKRFIDNAEHQQSILQAMHASGVPPKDDPLPNVAAMMTLWKATLRAQGPVTALKSSFKGKGKEEAFVDIVARGGAQWIKIYSKKPSQLIAEFREQDSYINSDFDSDSDYDYDDAGPSIPKLTNSIIETAGHLLAVAQNVDRIPGAASPRVSLRLSRIDENPEDGYDDDRISRTFQAVRDMGVDLVFGDLAEVDLASLHVPRETPALRPTLKINLDPTALMGLCSDLLHHPLPPDEAGAKERFFRPADKIIASKARSRDHLALDHDWLGQSQNSKELVKNLMEELQMPLVVKIREVLEAAGGRPDNVEWYATKEAVQYLNEAMGSSEIVGEGLEQRRMRRLIGLEEGDFWEGSRYQGKEGVLKGLRVKIFDDTPLSTPDDSQGSAGQSFQASLAAITGEFLSSYRQYIALATDNSDPSALESATAALPNFLKPQRLPIPKVAQLSQPFPIVSLAALHRGAREGMTTLMLGNIVMRDLWSQPRWRVKGWTPGSQTESNDAYAAVWMLPYRTLGEGKRVKFEKGDYSYPLK
ncbi:hypothetical protein BCR39DRAFT_303286 [Naematelia encephala]|uniref:DUF1308 domain-containing protein n=1 Tax=Naematelia encephala TaxID=71784 RepID=A0A1Y2BF84_9TREE|nr:hypothetical protein BCR39DRAFT_303286 [Naematelia encephala]